MISYLQARIAEVRAEIEDLEKQLKQAIEYADWPKEHDTVWFANSWGGVTRHALSDLWRCNDIVAQNHLFRTQREADNEAALRQMRSGVRVLEKGREYWVPVYSVPYGFIATQVSSPSPIFLVAGLTFETEEKCEAWIKQWGDTLVGLLP